MVYWQYCLVKLVSDCGSGFTAMVPARPHRGKTAPTAQIKRYWASGERVAKRCHLFAAQVHR